MKTRWSMSLGALGCVLSLAACRTSPADDTTSETDAPIIEGNLEPTLYPAMGYLVFKITTGPHAGEIFRPDCGATLVAPRTVVTAAHCVQEKVPTGGTVVGVGFGDAFTGATYGVVGTWRDWVNPNYFATAVGPSPFPPDAVDDRSDLAVIGLDRDPDGITPMPLWTGAIPLGKRGLVIGYGRVQPGEDDDRDTFANRPDHRDRYPGIRKSFDIQVALARDVIQVDSVAADGRLAGGGCHGDSGSALFLDGMVSGVLSEGGGVGNEGPTGPLDLGPGCQTGGGASFASLLFPANAAFLTTRIAAIAAGASPAGAAGDP